MASASFHLLADALQNSSTDLQEFDPDLRMGGLLLNKVGGAAHMKWLQDAITASGVQARFLGGVPKVRPHSADRLCHHTRCSSQSSISGCECTLPTSGTIKA